MDLKTLEINNNKIDKMIINNNEEITFDKGNFSEVDHRLFLESFILFDKNFKEMEEYTQTKNYNDILIYCDKFINFLNQKYNKKERCLDLKINKENLKNYSNVELEEYIYVKFCINSKNLEKDNSNSIYDYFIDDNKSLLGLSNNNKKIFFIRKYPKYKTLLNNNINNKNEFPEINVPNIGNDKESRKKLINKLLNENCKEANYTKMEELAKMSEILHIINKVENYNVTNDESLNSKTKTYDSNSNKINNNNQNNDLNNSNLGKKRLIEFTCDDNEKKEKEKNNISITDNVNEINNLNFQNENLINNNNLLSTNNYMNNIFLSPSQNNVFNQQNNIITNKNVNINPPYVYNQMNLNNYFLNNNINKIPNYNGLINRQFISPQVFNMSLPMLSFPLQNINQSMIYEQNNQNPYFDNMHYYINQQNQNLNLMNSINYLNNIFNDNQSYPFFTNHHQIIFNNQNRELYNINNVPNVSNYINDVNINQNK